MQSINAPELLLAAQKGDKAALERLIEENTGLVYSLIRRFYGRGVETEDLFQIGCIGLYKAVMGYDASYGTQFSTYAVPKIIGEVRRFLRDDGLIKVSRSLRESATVIRRAREKLTLALGREPYLSEISAETGLEAEEIAEADLASTPVDSLQREKGEDGLALEGVIGDDGMEERLLDRLSVQEMLNELPEREAVVLKLRFMKGLTQEQTAKILGVSQVQVSRLQKKAIESMKRRLAPP